MASSGKTGVGSRQSVRIMPEDWIHPLPLQDYFDRPQRMEVDVGCGKGRFLLSRARRHPDINFFGIDRMLRRIRRVDRRAVQLELQNIRLLRADAYYTTTYLIPADLVSVYYIFFPDPWPKKKHHGHRLFDGRFVDALFRTLTADGVVHFATDHLPYFEEVRELMKAEGRFREVEPFRPADDEKTDFELMFLDKPIGRCSFGAIRNASS